MRQTTSAASAWGWWVDGFGWIHLSGGRKSIHWLKVFKYLNMEAFFPVPYKVVFGDSLTFRPYPYCLRGWVLLFFWYLKCLVIYGTFLRGKTAYQEPVFDDLGWNQRKIVSRLILSLSLVWFGYFQYPGGSNKWIPKTRRCFGSNRYLPIKCWTQLNLSNKYHSWLMTENQQNPRNVLQQFVILDIFGFTFSMYHLNQCFVEKCYSWRQNQEYMCI